MKPSTCIAVALALLFSPAVFAQSAVQRCESKDGSVTYSNTECPPGSAPVRKVNTDPPVSVEERKAAQERAKKDSSTIKQIDKERAQEEARAKREADQRAKAEAKSKERCERARRDLQRAKTTRAELSEQAATLDKMQKADREISRREADVAKDCTR
jgi:hypothetical protein